MQSLSALFQKKREQEVAVLDDKTVLYVARNVILREYGNLGMRNITPKEFREGSLDLVVSGSVWKSEMEITRGDLKKAINAECGQKIVENIYIKTTST